MKKVQIIFLLLIAISCSSKQDKNIFEPKTKQGNVSYELDDFNPVTEKQINNYEFWHTMNRSGLEIGVFKSRNGVKFKKPKFNSPYYFELEDGKLEVINHGEFGGAFSFIPKDVSKDTVKILDTNVIYIFRYKSEIYFLVGLAHMMDQGGAIAKLIRKGDEFEYEEILKLGSAPQAMSINDDKILIAGFQSFTILQNLNIKDVIETKWSSLYPNTVVTINDEDVYVGFRGGYAKISLTSKNIKYFKHKSIKQGA